MRRVRLIARTASAAALAVSIVACGGSPAGPSAPLTGQWGGDHVSLTLTDAGGGAEFDCAHGAIAGALTADAAHAFRVSGTFVREHGGPIAIGETPDVHPAVYSGSATDGTMQLTVTLTDSNAVVGTFTLVRSAPGRVVKCL